MPVRLSALDSSFLHLETRNTHMHIGGLAVFEPGSWKSDAERYEALVRHIEPRLDLMPRYRQKVAFLPLNVDIPAWVDDEKFDIRFHVRRAAVPKPGDDAQVCELIERIFSRQLDRRHPLWELYYLEGLSGGRWGLLTKTHHALVDGLSALELVTVLLDTSAEYEPPREGSRWSPHKEPTGLDLVLESLRTRATQPIGLVRSAAQAASNPRRLAAAVAETAGAVAVAVRESRAPESPLNGPTGPSRTFRFSRFSLPEFKEVKTAFNATINDVVLGVVSGGLRKYLELHDEDVDHMTIKALCPVSLRDESQRTALGNVLSMLLVTLPVNEPFPAARMRQAKANVDRLKKTKQALGADILLKLPGYSPATLHSMVARAALRQIGFNTIVTNVPGPQWPLYSLGCRLEEAIPCAFLYEGQQLATAIFSYMGGINFGYIADRHKFPDLDRLARCMDESFAELLDVARAGRQESAPAAPAARARAAARTGSRASAASRREGDSAGTGTRAAPARRTGANGATKEAGKTGGKPRGDGAETSARRRGGSSAIKAAAGATARQAKKAG
jgi:WS/DGAT/MGAT family acyltransferase